jgi:DNA polymerase III subunit delta'
MKHLIGNTAVRDVLTRLIRNGRVPNALLFAGPEGVGKKQFAIELARSFVCTNASERLACGECAACRRAGEFDIPRFERGEDAERVFFGQHPDVGLVVPYKRNVRIGSIRALEREANFLPFEASARVFVIDDADKMNDASSNALLKTLEEPPATSHIILMASRADSLLPTIRSRCQVIRFAPVPAPDIEAHLVKHGLFSAEEAALAAGASGGSIGRALEFVPASFLDQRSSMLDVVRSAINSDRLELLRLSEEMNDPRNKDEFEERLGVLDALIHDVWLLKNEADEAGLFNRDLRSDLSELAGRVERSVLPRWLTQIEELREGLAVNVNRKISTDALFVGMSV